MPYLTYCIEIAFVIARRIDGRLKNARQIPTQGKSGKQEIRQTSWTDLATSDVLMSIDSRSASRAHIVHVQNRHAVRSHVARDALKKVKCLLNIPQIVPADKRVA